ncbi:hypothetical protein SOM37_22830 [Bacillus thuringiensis]|uniref:hypothetical protein n=1 Tax=Bacillus thuringiensis TaxID=1428 RepID=UPI002A6AF0D4|nr:hypothetical protein [Bacillus thuringiensis]MDY0951695.1 hypothetical protein [Bacillus thuringiensis]
MELNKLEKAMIVGIILQVLRSRKKLKKYVGLDRLADVCKVFDEVQGSTSFENREGAITSIINKLMDDLLEEDKGSVNEEFIRDVDCTN